jgi:hypothetical protein
VAYDDAPAITGTHCRDGKPRTKHWNPELVGAELLDSEVAFSEASDASILYLLLLIQYLGIPGYEVPIATGIQTIVLSVLLHGLTAAPLARIYGRRGEARTSPG